ncbi:MAG TPA: hypothetical protein VK745_12795 [Polyangiaceae bacterium]|nr:hypothetical protein [Polyangiaceae bacterium]
MRHILELGLGTVVALAFAVGCGGSSNSTGTGGSSSSAGSTASGAGESSTSGGASSTSGGASSTSGGASSTSGGASYTVGPFTTSLPASTSLGSLTSAQATQLCTQLDSYLNSITTYECELIAVVEAGTATSDAAAQTMCQTLESACSATGTTTDSCTAPGSSCMATVGDLEGCLNDTTATLKSAAVPACATLTLAQAQALAISFAGEADGGPAEPTSCTSFAAKCPDSNMLPPSM